MASIGYFLSSEEFGPRELARQARLAEQHGFERLWISDHYHPWNAQQGHSPFVWSVIGALSEVTSLPITTAVTCPTVRIHPAVLAQATATAAVQCQGRFVFGVGSGEALNEHILGGPWPNTDIRLSMLEEAVEVIRALHRGGVVSYEGRHYTVNQAQVYTLPEQPVPIYVSGFGPKAAELAGRIGDGFICVKPEADLVRAFRQSGGGDRPAQGGFKVCYAPDRDRAITTAHRLWANQQLPGELAQVLPTPQHFEQASSLVTPEMIASVTPCGPDPELYLRSLQEYLDAGYDEIYVQQIGPEQDEFFRFWEEQIRPRLSREVSAAMG
ncbi:MAG: TIGR03557 family F420-dependent LLM class oxidoreductase [Kutzneria sp.]|nr:TIGR03557 family F420-dependent LLM class oxidoreductase [Kutzneria sp.]MBV9844663.1 TIGR03557 family F420-dependent LLM class oxidoreductase [Kutzneria sp.]